MAGENQLSIQRWLDATASATLGIAPALGCDGGSVTGPLERLEPVRAGAYIPMICEEDCLQIGFVADAETCQRMARAFLCMEPEDEDLPAEDLADAIGELVNVLAGAVKTEIVAHDPSVKLGLPVFVQGELNVGKQEAAYAEVQLGEFETQVIVLRQGA